MLFGRRLIEAATDIRFQRYQKCISQNPSCYWGPRELLFYAADAFTWNAMASSNTSNHLPGPPTYEAMATAWGVQQLANGTYGAVPGQLPGSPWYRCGQPLTVADGGAAGVVAYTAHPVLFGSNSGAVNTFVPM